MRVELKKLKRCQEQKKHDFAPQIRVNSPKGVTSSIMIRGMNIAEALPIAEQYMDDAYRSGYGEVAIIHGRGEGILRKEVQALCKRTPFVESYRLGGAHEGGYGVTIVRFSK